MAKDRDAERDRGEVGPRVPVRAVRRLLLDAVLLIEEADLRLEELGVVTLRERLLTAAGKLVQAADGLTNGTLKNEDGR